MGDEVKLGIVGCGGISHAHARAAMNIAGKVKFVACCDIHEEAAKSWAHQYGCDGVYTDYEKMIGEEDLDGVLFATWPTQHRDQIEKCLGAGVSNILCEKALTLTGKEAVEIWELVKSANAFLMEGFMYRHHPAIHKLKTVLSYGELGPVDNVRAVFSSYDPEEPSVTDLTRNWRQRKECGGGVPYDYACYAINACGYFAGDIPIRVYAAGSVSEKYDILNRLYGIIEYANGFIGIIESSKKADFSQELQITCARGILNLPLAWTIYEETDIKHFHSAGWAKVLTDIYSLSKADAYQLQLENFADVIRGKAGPGVPLIQSVVNTFTIEALVSSLLEKRAVEIEIPNVIEQTFTQLKEENR